MLPKPFAGTDTAEFTFRPEGDQTVVTWSMEGRNNFMAKAIHLVMNMDKMIGAARAESPTADEVPDGASTALLSGARSGGRESFAIRRTPSENEGTLYGRAATAHGPLPT